jgi:hypothetical protein
MVVGLDPAKAGQEPTTAELWFNLTGLKTCQVIALS